MKMNEKNYYKFRYDINGQTEYRVVEAASVDEAHAKARALKDSMPENTNISFVQASVETYGTLNVKYNQLVDVCDTLEVATIGYQMIQELFDIDGYRYRGSIYKLVAIHADKNICLEEENKMKTNNCLEEEDKMKTNNYTFKAWHNGEEEYYVYDVQANDIREAYEKAYARNHDTPGTGTDVELITASTLQVWEVCLTAPTKFPMFFTVQAYSEPEAIVAAKQHCSVEYPSDYSILYVAHKREVK